MALFDSAADGPDFSLERRYGEGRPVCGVDEAGRGPLAGPVVAAAVLLDPARIPPGLNDSKKLLPATRERLYALILDMASVSVAAAPPALIDALNIRGATLWAMARAVEGLAPVAAIALIDGRDVPPGLCCPGVAVVRGDGRSFSIAAASIVAKVVRDRMCAVLHAAYPAYGIARHKGYPTAVHLAALARSGATEHHRVSFAPVARLVTGG
ncbi:MAG TPA: ribonuclease HII [Devosiaceae bacterium]|nr:ribonuclease HII [Devosiaceae bacterium]